MTEPFEIFKVLCVDTRMKIIDLLQSQGPLGATEIAKSLGITPAAVSQHLKILKQIGLVSNQRKGYWIPYSLNENALENCRQALNGVCKGECKSDGKFKAKAINSADMKSLKQYEQELQRELKRVQDRLEENK